jgi:lysophospholipase L1-like esterase
MRWMAAALIGALFIGPALAADPICEVPDHLAHSGGRLDRVHKAAKQEQRLEILVVGTGSSTLSGAEGVRNAYPAKLEAALGSRLPGIAVTVRTDVKNRRTTADMDKAIEVDMPEIKPTLVVWQAGTVDAMRGIDPDEFRASLEHGIQGARAGGADVVLVNMQYSPRTESMIAVGPYAESMRWVAQQQDLPLLDRLAIMRHWNETGAFDLSAADKNQTAERVHDCIGKLLAELIIDSAHLDNSQPKAIR